MNPIAQANIPSKGYCSITNIIKLYSRNRTQETFEAMAVFTPYQRDLGKLSQGTLFSDKRIQTRFNQLFNRMCIAQESVIHRMSKTEAEEQAYYRLLSNDRFSFEGVLGNYCQTSSAKVKGRHVLAIGDSSEFNLNRQARHFKDSASCGYLSNNRTRGLISHVMIALDAEHLWGLGLCDLQLWSRAKSTKKKSRKQLEKLSPQEKESYKWILGVDGSEEVLSSAKRITYIFDREADILNLYQHIEAHESDFVIRLGRDRKLTSPSILISKLMEQLDPQGVHRIKISSEKKRSSGGRSIKARMGREAELNIRYTPVQLKGMSRTYYIVDALETPETTPDTEDPIHWRLLTSHPVVSMQGALQILTYYTARWMIEQLFRIVKKQGFQVESTQLKKVSSVRKQILLSLGAGFEVLQLILARDKKEQRPIGLHYNLKQQACLKELAKKLEGNTSKQQNPHKADNLAFATWVMARLGGWKGYQSKRPPGPIRILRGVRKFHAFFDAYTIFDDSS